MPTLDIDGTALAWDESGPPSAATPSVVLLHGLGARAGDWSLQIPALAGRHHVVAVDLPGHGRSALPRERLTIDAVREHFRTHPAVASLRRGEAREGGDGATIVELK